MASDDTITLFGYIDNAKNGLNKAREALSQWDSDEVASVALTAGQKTALNTAITTGVNQAKASIGSIEAVLSG